VRGLSVLVAIGLATAARADTPLAKPEAIDVDRLDTPPGRTELSFDGGAPLAGPLAITLATHWLERPIELANLEPVRRRQTVTLGAAFALAPSIIIDARIGAAHQIGDRLGTHALDRWVSTDLRLGARAQVAGTPARGVFLRADLGLPTGDDGDFAGDAKWSLAWRLIGRLTTRAGVLAATAGIRLRGAEVQVGDKLVGDELLLALGTAIPLPAVRPLWCRDGVKLTAELVAIIGDDVDMREGPTPVEARAGIVTRPTAELTIGVRAGAGLTDEIGSPRYRATLELTYAP
jgi:hypothetical protein